MTRTQGANAALKDGTVAPDGFTLEFEEVDPLIRAFRRMVRDLEYDVCELAITTYLCAKEHGKRFTALPVFLVRGFHHGAILAPPGTAPKDLEGGRAGVNRGYTVTTGVWARGVLADEHGVDLDRVTWVLSGDEHVAEYVPPPNVVPAEEGEDLAASLRSGSLSAAIGIDAPDVGTLIPDAEEAGYAALRERGHYPINHLVVVRDELLEAQPELAGAVFRAFEEAKERYVERLRAGAIESPTAADRMHRRVLEELVEHALAQKILRRRPDLDALFAPV